MNVFTKKVVVDSTVRELCGRPYPNHPKGCPNHHKRAMCPPRCLFLEDYYDISKGFYVIWIEFNIGAHIRRMAERHPNWSQRQKECCLYWQGTANKMLREEILKTELILPKGNWKTSYCPEAMGVNVTATMKNLGVILEWPPQEIVRKVAIIGIRKKKIKKT